MQKTNVPATRKTGCAMRHNLSPAVFEHPTNAPDAHNGSDRRKAEHRARGAKGEQGSKRQQAHRRRDAQKRQEASEAQRRVGTEDGAVRGARGKVESEA